MADFDEDKFYFSPWPSALPEVPVPLQPVGSELELQRAMDLLSAQAANTAAHIGLDVHARSAYQSWIQQMSSELRSKVKLGTLTWREAASEANFLRNELMASVRRQSSPVGRAMAERLKSEGKTLNTLIGEKTQQLYGKEAKFGSLRPSEKNRIYAEVVKAAGRSRPEVNRMLSRLSFAGRGLLVFSLSISVYKVAAAENKGREALQEGALLGSGIAGGIAGGAVAGLACGPGAPVCVGVGAFVGGTLAALGVTAIW